MVFDQYEFYQKMSFRNRCQIASAGGRTDLSIPLVGGRDQKTRMKEVKIANEYRWQDQHWKTLLACYSRSPWFEFYRDDLEGLYRKPFVFLLDWNLVCFDWTCRTLGFSARVSLTEEYRPVYEEEGWLDGRGKLQPKTILREPDPVKYRQVFEEITGFIPHLSILDLLFCEGQRARSLLAQVAPTS